MIGKNRIRQDVDAEVLGQMLNATLDPYLAIVVVATGELILPIRKQRRTARFIT